ncbi:unnamed protein product [Callosobruchus maculatus]|uniref:Uncharacterized protein n=2 Tax=Callosobruchus maculatus TaxID=64391 RepID=A0A653C570_CALMS|nr:unnamed protein product [Callosobruchus maculatus]
MALWLLQPLTYHRVICLQRTTSAEKTQYLLDSIKQNKTNGNN